MKKFVLLVFLSAFSVFSQNLHQRFDAFPVIIGGSPANSPFSGGIDIARYQFVDMDNDNDFDLFIYDKDTNLNYYRNEGSPSSASFKMQTKKYFSLSFKNWFFFTDIDNDNDKDLFCGGDSQHVRYIKNIGSASNPAYQLQTFMLLSDLGQPVISEAPCIPVFVDIDADGDIDFITGSQIGQLTYYQNIGNASNFNFRFITDFFAGLRIIGGGYDLHGASSITFEDIDSDGDRDLFWGDLFNPSLYFIRNTGTAQNFSWTVIDSTYPVPNAWFSGGYNMPRVHDIDNDGKKDLFLTVLTGTSAKNNFTYYRNTGTVINPQFTKITENFIKTIEVGGSSFPFFADIDNDGDFDLFIGGDRPYVSFFRNSGSASSPQLTLEADSLPIAYTNFNFSPTIADLDNDGRKDLVCGAFDGKLRYYKNNGTVQNPIFSFTASQFDGIDVGQSSAPLFFDLDNDNDFDMLVGNSDGKLYYYINNGSPSSFNFQLVTSNYQSIFVGNDSAPSLGDLDGDGDPDMLVGCRLGVIYYYINNGSVGNPNFSFVSNNYAGINVFYTSTPAIVDINTDSDKDLFVGNVKGGLYFYENWNVFGIKQIGSEIPKDFKLYQNYPNPFNPVTSFKFQVSSSALVNIKVYDILGKEVQTIINEQLSSGIYEVEWDASNYPSGIYFYRIIAGEFHQTKKMMLVK